MKKIFSIALILLSLNLFGQSAGYTLYAIRLNTNGTTDSIDKKDFTDSLFLRTGLVFVAFTREYYLRQYQPVIPNGFANYVNRGDGIWVNQNLLVNGATITPATVQTSLDLKANLASPVLTGTPVVPGYVPTTTTVNGHALSANVSVTQGDVGLSNVDNTTDVNKPVSTAQQTALNLKANLASPTFTGTVVLPSATVYNTPTIGTSGSSGTSHIKTVGSIPTVAQTGLGSGGSVGVALETGSTDAAGIITLTTGNASVGSTGTVTLTFNGAYSGNQPVIVLTLVKGATDWGALATVRQTTQSLTAPIFTWNNSATGTALALTSNTTYKISYIVIQK